MRDFAKISPQIWTSDIGRKIKNLGLEARVVSFYLSTNPSAHMSGVYYIPVVLIAHESGLSVEQAIYVLNELCLIGFCSYDYDYEYVWVHDMGIDQVSDQLKLNDNRVKAIKKHYALLPNLSFIQAFHEKYVETFHLNNSDETVINSEAPQQSLRSKENEKENDNEKERKTILSSDLDIDCEKHYLPIEKQTSFSKKELSAAYLSQATDILNFLNEKTKCRYRLEDNNLKLIISRLKSGATLDECRAVIARKYRDWHGTEMQKYLRPATLFNATKFEQYLGECVIETSVQN